MVKWWTIARGNRRHTTRRPGAVACFAGATAALPLGGLLAADIALANSSFELPSTPFVSTIIEGWQRSPKPAWYDESGGFLWEQLTGLFLNPPPTSADRILNCHGDQAAWLFAVPEVGLFQELTGTATIPEAAYLAGRSYRLIVGILGGGGNMADGATLALSLYYRDDTGTPTALATTTVTNRPGLFGNPKQFLDYEVRTPVVQPADAWQDRPIGVRFVSTATPDLQGGYWDLDHVRLQVSSETVLRDPRLVDGHFQFDLEGAAGQTFEVLAASALTSTPASWERVGTVTNLTGRVIFSEPVAGSAPRFYSARQLD
ncbi:MAG: hypothetical protein HS113_13010 [Verrucomicrobiales bacterium]|nr:hypothetical protein [Verrucomicrobiales bacterium]